jgi:alkylhydroperoxidase family enzyme
MARIPYTDPGQPDVRPAAEQIRAKRGGVTALHRMLLHSPALALGWVEFIKAVREKCSLPSDVRELAILRVASLSRSAYQTEQHAKSAIKAGLTRAQCAAVSSWQISDLFDRRQRAVLAYTDSVTRDLQVPDGIFEAVREQFSDREIVELTATIAAYNLLARLLEPLQVRASDVDEDGAVNS